MDFDENMTIEEVFAEADRRSKDTMKTKLPPKVKQSFGDTLSSADNSLDIRRSRRHDKSLEKIMSKSEISQKTTSVDSSNIIPTLRRSSRANKGKGKEVFDPSHIPQKSRSNNEAKKDQFRDLSSDSESLNSNNSSIKITKDPVPIKSTFNKKEITSKTKSKSKPVKTTKPPHQLSDDDDIASSSEESDDDSYNDPNRLWCICKKPHDDRFMISCDKCQEWYHGDCVGITVQLGKQMEKRGEEYVCPKCQNKRKNKANKSGVKLKGYAHDHETKRSKHEPLKKESRTCIVKSCENLAQDDSVYCSNVCILRHARESLQNKVVSKQEKKKSEKEIRKEKARERLMKKISDSASLGRVALLCCDTGKILSGDEAPLKTELKSYLARHPSFQILRLKKPATSTANVQKDAHKQSLQHTSYNVDPDYNPRRESEDHSEEKPRKHKLEHPHRRSSDEHKKSKKDHSQSRRHSSTDQSKSPKQHVHKTKSVEKEYKSSESKSSNEQENKVRSSVRKVLREILSKRSENSNDLKMHPSSIDKLVRKVEESLYKTYGGVSFKYKSKYRSMMFNLKDEKNEGLWRKVIVGEVSSSRLVKMTAEEMASKELAEWREHELNQELELINKLETEKKSERPIAKITHKGEIELDEDLSDLTNSHMGEKTSPTIVPARVRRISTNKNEDGDISLSTPTALDTTSEHSNHLFDMNCRICTGQVKESNSPESHKSVRKSTSIILSNEAQNTVGEELTTEKILQGITSKIQESSRLSFDDSNSSLNHPVSPDDDANIGTTPPYESPLEESKLKSNDHTPKTKSNSTVIVKPDPSKHVWSGVISMPELSSFSTNAYVVSGNVEDLVPAFPSKLMLDGRIHPKVVWDYIGKVKTLANKEVCVIQFHAASVDDKVGYISMLSYFSSRKRFGVVNNQNPLMIKDIYLVPLLETQPIPTQLLSLKGLKFPTNRHSMLLGVLVLCKPLKRPLSAMEKIGLTSNLLTNAKKSSSKLNISKKSPSPSKETVSVQQVMDATSVVADENEDEYNPETADFDNAEDNSEPYDPESYEPESENTVQVSTNNVDDDAPYDPELEAERMESSELQALKEKQAFLEEMKQKLDAQKAQLDEESMTLQSETQKKTAVVDPRMAARMHKQSRTNTVNPGILSTDSPLQKILSVLNMETKK